MDQVIDPADPDALDAVPVESGPGRTIAVVAAWVAVVAVIGVALWLFFTNVVDSSDGTSVVESYTKGETGKRYSSVRDGFRVVMPTTPTRREIDDAAGPTVVVASRPGSGYSFSVTRSPQSDDALANYTAALDTAAGSLAADSGAEIVSQTDPVPYVNIALKDVVFRKGSQWYRARLVLTADRLYTVQAETRSRDAAPFDHLWKTFKILRDR